MLPRLCQHCAHPFIPWKNRQTFCSKSCSRRYRDTQTLEERFWAKVDKTSNPDGCWLWTGALQTDGYGSFAVPAGFHSEKKSTVLAHRFAYTLLYGPIPTGHGVLHKPPCDIKRCIRHLYTGTPLQNNQDAITMGTVLLGTPDSLPQTLTRFSPTSGSANPYAKLTEDVVLAIRADYATQALTQRQIAAKYHTSLKNVRNIVRRRTWAHLHP